MTVNEFGKTRPSNRTIEVPESIARSVPEIGKLKRTDWTYFARNRKTIVDQWNEIVIDEICLPAAVSYRDEINEGPDLCGTID
jgi:hypothetical protein